ncbi:hypothetical protein D9M69_573420 [compost metagenome]
MSGMLADRAAAFTGFAVRLGLAGRVLLGFGCSYWRCGCACFEPNRRSKSVRGRSCADAEDMAVSIIAKATSIVIRTPLALLLNWLACIGFTFLR